MAPTDQSEQVGEFPHLDSTSNANLCHLSLDRLSAIVPPGISSLEILSIYIRWLELHRCAHGASTSAWVPILLQWSKSLRSHGVQPYEIVNAVSEWQGKGLSLSSSIDRDLPSICDVERAFMIDAALSARVTEAGSAVETSSRQRGSNGRHSAPLVRNQASLVDKWIHDLYDEGPTPADLERMLIKGDGCHLAEKPAENTGVKSYPASNTMVSRPKQSSGGTDGLPRSQLFCDICGRRGHQCQDCVINEVALNLNPDTRMQKDKASALSTSKPKMDELDGQNRATKELIPDKKLPYEDSGHRRMNSISVSDYSARQISHDCSRQQETLQKSTKLQKKEKQRRLQIHENVATIARRTAEINAQEPSEKRQKRSHRGYEPDDWRDTNYIWASAQEANKEYQEGSGIYETTRNISKQVDTHPCLSITIAEAFLDEIVAASLNQRASTNANQPVMSHLISSDNQNYTDADLYGPNELPRAGMTGSHTLSPAPTGFATRSQTSRYHPRIQELRKRRREMNEIVNRPQRRPTGLEMWHDFWVTNHTVTAATT